MSSQASPRVRIALESARRGRENFVEGCIDVLNGSDVDGALIRVLGGVAAQTVLEGWAGGVDGYWPRVWAVRGLLHCYEPLAESAVERALGDPSWRVREMALKVIARHRIENLLDAAIPLMNDEVERVAVAATRVARVINVA